MKFGRSMNRNKAATSTICGINQTPQNHHSALRHTGSMPFGFYIIMAAQFFSSLADNALLVAAIATLVLLQSPEWFTPMLKLFFTVSYVLLAPFVGAFADSMPKGRVMFITNLIKIAGCLMMLFGVHPLLAYAVVGLGAAAYSPAKYGILTEYLPHHKLVVANGWIEGLTVASIILGTLLGGVLISHAVSTPPARDRSPGARDRHRHRAGDRHPADRRVLRDRGGLQSLHPEDRRRSRRAQQEPGVPGAGVRALPATAVARQARADLARDDHAVLGRRRDAAVHRAQVGGDGARLLAVAGDGAAGHLRRRASRSAPSSPRASCRCTAPSTWCRSASPWDSS